MMLTEVVEYLFCGMQRMRVALDGSGELCNVQFIGTNLNFTECVDIIHWIDFICVCELDERCSCM
jgi:hypothetical protein